MLTVEGILANVPVYTDDLALLAANPRDLQLLLNKVQIWCPSNGITVNMDKTKIMHFRTKRSAQSKFDYTSKCGIRGRACFAARAEVCLWQASARAVC